MQSFCIASFASTSQDDSTGVAQIDNKTYVEYNVSPGETIYGISTKYKVNVEDLLEINPQLTNGLKVGQIILIPIENWNIARVAAAKKAATVAKSETKPIAEIKPNTEVVVKTDREESGKTYHTVQPGETMYSLSKKYGVSVSDLVMMNVPDLKVGQEIVVKSDKVKIKDVAQQVAKPKEVENTNKLVIKDNTKPSSEAPQAEGPSDDTTNVVYSNNVPNVLVIPFDPHLYWSDADMEISKQSKMEMQKVRQSFRKRLNTLLEPKGYNTIHLMGGQVRDSLTDLNRIYSSVSYDYKDVIYSEANPKPAEPKQKTDLKTDVKNGFNNAVNGVSNIFNKDKDKPAVQQQPTQGNTSRAVHAKNPAKYYAVSVRDPNFFTYFNNKYHTDYYIFVNQFEVETDYEHCLDRARQNYERNFVTHFSIYDKSGKQVAGHRIITHYNSNSNNIGQILKDNMEIIAARILAELPKR